MMGVDMGMLFEGPRALLNVLCRGWGMIFSGADVLIIYRGSRGAGYDCYWI